MGGYAAVSSGRILECVRELAAAGQPVTREAIVRLSGLKKLVVDDRLRALVDAEQMRRTSRGVYELVEQYPPPRKMSKTILADGYVEIVVGDEVLLLSPSEDRHLAMLQAGAATAVAAASFASQQQQALVELMGAQQATSRDMRRFQDVLGSAAGMMKREMQNMRSALARKAEQHERAAVQPALCLRHAPQKRKDCSHGSSKENRGKAAGGQGSQARKADGGSKA